MKIKHIYIPVLDVAEILPFVVKKTETLHESLQEQERAKSELVRFIDKLEKNFEQKIFYMGMDIISEKSYERFIFDMGGFFEVMVEAPVAMNAHFVHNYQAAKFKKALKKTIKEIIPYNNVTKMFVENISIQKEIDTSLTVERWNKIRSIRELSNK